jgi:hypothetical protein
MLADRRCDVSTPSSNQESCISCGRSTRVGTPLFSDRRTTRTEDGTALHLCGDCNERAVSHYGRRLTEQDMVQISARGAGAGLSIR